MTSFDLSPLYKSAIGFDRFAQYIDEAMRQDSQSAYPPFNVERLGDDDYRITMAVAGFTRDELDLEVEGDVLKVTGRKADKDQQQEEQARAEDEAPQQRFLHRGIAQRSFERQFRLADHVKVISAELENGLLHIGLQRQVPEALKPRKIDIASNDTKALTENAA